MYYGLATISFLFDAYLPNTYQWNDSNSSIREIELIDPEYYLLKELEQKYPNRLIYDENVLGYLNSYEEVRNTLPKIIGAIFDKLGDVKLQLALDNENEKELEIYIRFRNYDDNTLIKIGEVAEYCADDLLEVSKNDENLWIHLSTDFADYNSVG